MAWSSVSCAPPLTTCGKIVPSSFCCFLAGFMVSLWPPLTTTIGHNYCCLKTLLVLMMGRDHALYLKDLPIRPEEAFVLASRQLSNALHWPEWPFWHCWLLTLDLCLPKCRTCPSRFNHRSIFKLVSSVHKNRGWTRISLIYSCRWTASDLTWRTEFRTKRRLKVVW